MDTELKMNRKVSALWKGTDWYPATIVKVGMCAEMHAFSMEIEFDLIMHWIVSHQH
jgi:hypothetical protein